MQVAELTGAERIALVLFDGQGNRRLTEVQLRAALSGAERDYRA
jgi:hypothetical protein